MEDILGREILHGSVIHYNNALYVVKSIHYGYCAAHRISIIWGKQALVDKDFSIQYVVIADKPSRITQAQNSAVIPKDSIPAELLKALGGQNYDYL